MDKRTGFHIAIGVNMEIVTASCDAAAYILAVILKINREDGLGGTVLPHFPVHELTLLRIGQQVGHCFVTHWHVVEEPGELGPTLHQMIDKSLGADGVHIFRGVATGCTKGQFVLFQNSHSLHDCLIGARPPSKIGSVFKPFYADGGNKVFHPKHFLRKRIINQSSIGKSQELAVAVFGTQPEDVLFRTRGSPPEKMYI